MKRTIIKFAVLIIVYVCSLTLGLKDAKAEGIDTAIYLKAVNERLSSLIRENVEANIFLGEDLSHAIKTLDIAEIQLTDSWGSYPLLFSRDGSPLIYLSKHYSFQGTPEEIVSTVLTILFNIKNQLVGINAPVPELRTNLFAKKFSLYLLREENPCSISLYPLPFSLPSSEKGTLLNGLLPLLKKRGYNYSSSLPEYTIWFESKAESYSITRITAFISSFHTRTITEMGTIEILYSSIKPKDMNSVINKILRELNNHLPDCSNAFGNN